MSPPPESTFWSRNNIPESVREKCLAVLRVYVEEREYNSLKRREGDDNANGNTYKETIRVKVEGLPKEDQGWCSSTYVCTITVVDSPPSREIDTNTEGDDGSSLISMMTTTATIIQVRDPNHLIDSRVVCSARRTYGSDVVPWVRELKDIEFPAEMGKRYVGFEMERVRGVCAGTVLVGDMGFGWEKRVRMMQSLGRVLGRAWPDECTSSVSGSETTIVTTIVTTTTSTTKVGLRRKERADSPVSISPIPEWLNPCTGTVGAILITKLARLARELPSLELRLRAQRTLDRLAEIEDYPVVLNHGDLIPSNILVDVDTGEVGGLVDWAEGEVLPFGVCFGGVEWLLGSISHSISERGRGRARPVFEYCEGADELRRVFWRALVDGKGELEKRMDEVKLMRDVGVLLWEGYAWDGGKIDRVVNEVDDEEGLARLRAFLGVGDES